MSNPQNALNNLFFEDIFNSIFCIVALILIKI